MRIWIDLTNSPHVNFFAGMITELRRDHEVVLTSRPLANTIDLLELNGFSYHVIGKHYGQSKVKKALGFGVRILQLYRFLKGQRPDVAISHSSFYSPMVGRLLGIPVIYLNDNEHAAGNRISFLFADRIMVPEFLDLKKVERQWAKPAKILSYPGVKEGVYLWDYSPSSGSFALDDRAGKKVIFVRPEPWTAQYYKGERNFMDKLLLDLKVRFKVVLLPRGEVQEDYYRDKRFAGITVLEKSISLSEIMALCDLFIGAGGTMTREAAVLGIPTISIYQDELLDVDRFLMESGFMVHQPNPDAESVIRLFESLEKRPPDKELLKKGREAYELIKGTLLENGGEKKRNRQNG
jgi:predicted glycosyltransferase